MQWFLYLIGIKNTFFRLENIYFASSEYSQVWLTTLLMQNVNVVNDLNSEFPEKHWFGEKWKQNMRVGSLDAGVGHFCGQKPSMPPAKSFWANDRFNFLYKTKKSYMNGLSERTEQIYNSAPKLGIPYSQCSGPGIFFWDVEFGVFFVCWFWNICIKFSS